MRVEKGKHRAQTAQHGQRREGDGQLVDLPRGQPARQESRRELIVPLPLNAAVWFHSSPAFNKFFVSPKPSRRSGSAKPSEPPWPLCPKAAADRPMAGAP